MKEEEKNIKALLSEIEVLKDQLFDANNIIDAIREGAVDALVLHKDGQPQIYSIESADYTYRILIEKSGEGALSLTDEGLILYCNDYFSKLVGVPSNKIIGSYFSDFLTDSEEQKHLKTTLETGTSKGEAILYTNSKSLPVYLSFTNLQPNVHAIGLIVTDLTEQKKQELNLIRHQYELETKILELHNTNANLEQFIHVISHDLKEPLRKILTYTSLLEQQNSEEISSSNATRVIQSSAVRLNSLVDDLVKYAFSAVKDEIDEINLVEVFQEVMDDLELTINENKAKIQIDQLPVIKGSKVQMRQLFSNLIANAIKYAKDNVEPVIKVTSQTVKNPESGKDFYKISLHDNGIGIHESHLGKIFTIFQRLHMRNEYSGNGIGLAICKKIMENHSGRIDVESTLNDGSCFILYFPIQINDE